MKCQRKLRKIWHGTILGVTFSGILAVTPVPAVAFEPLSTLAVSVGTSLVVKGFNYLFGKAVQAPDLHFAKTQQIHSELREVQRDVLANRTLMIEIHAREGLEHEETRKTTLEAEERLKAFISSNSEKERIALVLAGVTQVNKLAERVRASTGKERIQTTDVLNIEISGLERMVAAFAYGEYLRAAMILPRIAAIQSRWTALSVLPHMVQHRKSLVIEEGSWLAAQRLKSGSRDPASMTLGDIIANFEEHVIGLDFYLGSLSDPCSPLWYGYITVDATESGDTLTIRKVGVSQVRRKFEGYKSFAKKNSETVRFANNPLIQPTELQWDHYVKELPNPVTWKIPIEAELLSNRLELLHDEAFGCQRRIDRLARQRLAEAVPALINPRHETEGIGAQPIDYDAIRDETGKPQLTVERLLSRKPCVLERQCRQHWEHAHMRREIMGSILATLYAIRSEVNKNLEWLAEETTGAKCTFLRDEPRVCVFPPTMNNVSAASTKLDEWSGGTARIKTSASAKSLQAYQITRKFQKTFDAVRVAATRHRHAQQRMRREQAIGTMKLNLQKRAKTVALAQRNNDRHLDTLAQEAVRKAWMQFALSVVQDQIIDAIETHTEAYLTEIFTGKTPVKEFPNQWTSVAFDVPQTDTTSSKESSVAETSREAKMVPKKQASGAKRVLVAMVAPSQEPSKDTSATKAVTEEIKKTGYGTDDGLSAAQKFALWLPPIPPKATNFAAGLGDGVTIGLTRKVRKWTGLSAEVDTATRAYVNGTLTGTVTLGASSGGHAIVTALKAGKAGAQLLRMGKFSLHMRLAKGPTSGISIINHAIKRKPGGKILSFDVPTKLGGGGRLIKKLPHFHIRGPKGKWVKLHLPWEPKWLLPTFGKAVGIAVGATLGLTADTKFPKITREKNERKKK
ncbi:MAG: hypothetical protein OXL41_00035 [Nitrospinae bacterium]|nr:hypothetical protein [Nitrospinota bacterium]